MNKREQEILQSQLNTEKQTIKRLKQVYAQAIRDCEKKIRELSMRTDLENIQSIVYQKQYQQAIKGQLEGILEQLHSNEYATISEYLTKCYHEGYIGTMYDLEGQGIPIIMPIDQEAVTQAIQIDSKLSKTLYESLGQDVNKLKTAVKAQVSRGIAAGLTWNQVAENLANRNMKNTPYGTAINNAIRIARTEGHRIQVASAMDAQEVAKSKGADILKQWNAALDGRTRPHHRMLDGQIRELKEDFEVSGMKVKAPGYFGKPSEDCNCRCALSTRARWALDEAELEKLKQRAAYYELDKTEDFEDYKNKYLKASEEERVRVDVQKSDESTSQEKALEKVGKSGKIGARSNVGEPVYYDKNNDYSIKIESLDQKVNNELSRVAKILAEKGSKDRCEHMYLVDLSGELESYYETNEETNSVGIDFWQYVKKYKNKQFAFVHNHNTANSFSIPDLETPITTDNILYQIVVRDDGVKYIAERVKMAPRGYYPDEYFADKLVELNNKSRNNEITPYERANEREKIIIESMINEFYKIEVSDGRK